MVKRKNKAAMAAAKAAHEARVANIILHFDTTYTYNDKLGLLAAFQKLCADLNVDVGTTLKLCKEVHTGFTLALHDHILTHSLQNVKLSSINIHDFVCVQEAGGDVSAVKFPTNEALRDDIKKSRDRRFPLHMAKDNVFLTAMLIDV